MKKIMQYQVSSKAKSKSDKTQNIYWIVFELSLLPNNLVTALNDQSLRESIQKYWKEDKISSTRKKGKLKASEIHLQEV